MPIVKTDTTITAHEAAQLEHANTNRGHALTIDSGWREIADTALAFAQRFARTHPTRPRPPTTDTQRSPSPAR
jgi:hypothetical protein